MTRDFENLTWKINSQGFGVMINLDHGLDWTEKALKFSKLSLWVCLFMVF